MSGEDRLTLLLEQSAVTGIDFIQVVDPEDQTVLRVFFLINPDELDDPIVETADLPVDVSTGTVTILSVSGGERLAEAQVVRTTYRQVPLNGKTRTVLEIETAEPGDFSVYRLTIIDEPDRRIDRFFNGVEFSFKQGCPSLLDCRRETQCPPEELVDFPVDYLARDFVSIRNALLDFAAQRYPRWAEKIEADAGVMLAEVMAALGDELSYIQDRYAREGYLETATQRRSLRYHTQLVDYPIHDGLAAGTFLDLKVKAAIAGGPAGGTLLSAGSRIWAPGQGEPPIPFEIGEGLNDQRKTLLTLLFSVGLAFQADLDGGLFSTGLRQEFEARHIFFSDAPPPKVSVLDSGSRWLISQPTVTFLVAKENNALSIFGAGRQFWVHAAWNEMPVHLPDEGRPCLPVGARELFLRGTFPTTTQVPAGEDPTKFWIGKWLLVKTDPEDPSIPARRHLVRVVEIEHTTDPLFPGGSNTPLAITRVKWEDEQALPFEMCLRDMVVRGNMVFATAGETFTELFTIRANDNIPAKAAHLVGRAVERQGPLDDVACRRSVTFLYSLGRTEAEGLGWLGRLREARPEVELQEVDEADLLPFDPPQLWEWRRSLLDSRGFQDHFTLDHGTWRRIIGFDRIGEEIEHLDYASGSGFTIRFGDGEFGQTPGNGTVFRVRYRTGPGTKANLPADTVANLRNPANDAETDLAGVLDGVTNPLPVTGGLDPESAEAIKQLAPEAFRAVTFRAVRPEDYAEIAERLPFVQRAGARFRWTGSWLSMFVTADPRGSFQLSPERRTQLANLMDCVRQAGREVFVLNPRFVNIDLEISICVEPFAYAGQVKARVLDGLLGRKGVRPTRGFFHPDNFTFGTPLERSALEAAIQDVEGVRGVEQMRIRARGITDWRSFDELTFGVRHDQIIRLENDPRFPERGSLRIITREEEQA
jgi:hypothetical protein